MTNENVFDDKTQSDSGCQSTHTSSSSRSVQTIHPADLSIHRHFSSCLICLEPFTSQCALNCGHAFCELCIHNYQLIYKRLVSIHRNKVGSDICLDSEDDLAIIHCPICRQTTLSSCSANTSDESSSVNSLKLSADCFQKSARTVCDVPLKCDACVGSVQPVVKQGNGSHASPGFQNSINSSRPLVRRNGSVQYSMGSVNDDACELANMSLARSPTVSGGTASEEADFHCAKCELNLCKACRLRHDSQTLFRGHAVVHISSREAVELFCHAHPVGGVGQQYRPCQYFCLDCGRPECVVCVLLDNPSHQSMKLRDAVADRRDALKTLLNALGPRLDRLVARSNQLSQLYFERNGNWKSDRNLPRNKTLAQGLGAAMILQLVISMPMSLASLGTINQHPCSSLSIPRVNIDQEGDDLDHQQTEQQQKKNLHLPQFSRLSDPPSLPVSSRSRRQSPPFFTSIVESLLRQRKISSGNRSVTTFFQLPRSQRRRSSGFGTTSGEQLLTSSLTVCQPVDGSDQLVDKKTLHRQQQVSQLSECYQEQRNRNLSASDAITNAGSDASSIATSDDLQKVKAPLAEAEDDESDDVPKTEITAKLSNTVHSCPRTGTHMEVGRRNSNESNDTECTVEESCVVNDRIELSSFETESVYLGLLRKLFQKATKVLEITDIKKLLAIFDDLAARLKTIVEVELPLLQADIDDRLSTELTRQNQEQRPTVSAASLSTHHPLSSVADLTTAHLSTPLPCSQRDGDQASGKLSSKGITVSGTVHSEPVSHGNGISTSKELSLHKSKSNAELITPIKKRRDVSECSTTSYPMSLLVRPKLLWKFEKHRTDIGGVDMSSPSDVAFLADESALVVAEYDSVNERNNRLQLFDIQSGRSRGSLAQGQLQPLGVTLTRDGQHLAVTDCRGKRVRVISLATGQTVADIGKGQFGWPYGIAVTGRGQLVVTDAFSDTVSVYAPDGKKLKTFGGPAGSTTFRNPYHVAIDDRDIVLVSDCGNNCIKALDLGGHLLYCASDGARNLGSSDIFGFAGGSGGAAGLVISGPGSSDKKLHSPVAAATKKRGRLKAPRGIAIDHRQGNVIVADDRSRVCMFSSGGAYIRNLLTEDDSVKFPEAIECSKSGLLAVTEWSPNNAFAVKLFNLYE